MWYNRLLLCLHRLPLGFLTDNCSELLVSDHLFNMIILWQAQGLIPVGSRNSFYEFCFKIKDIIFTEILAYIK